MQFGRVRCLCAEKDAELPENQPSRKFKGGVVFLGNQIRNQYFETAAFADLSNSAATLEGARMADFYGRCRGNSSQQADANQACIQADTRGDPCWISLPIDAVVNKDAWCQYRQPVVRLRKALRGHPDSVTWWDEKTHREAQEAGFTPMGVDWPAMCLHRALRLLLVVYVDDFNTLLVVCVDDFKKWQALVRTWTKVRRLSSNVSTLEQSLDRADISVATSRSWYPNCRAASTFA